MLVDDTLFDIDFARKCKKTDISFSGTKTTHDNKQRNRSKRGAETFYLIIIFEDAIASVFNMRPFF